MDLSRFDSMEPSELRSYLAFLLWHYRVMDSFWFLYLVEEQGQTAAEQLNERVWARVSGLAARDLVTRFAVTAKGLAGFVEVLRLYPWSALLGYQIEQSPDEVVVTVPCCDTQEARRRRGLEEYLCADMHRSEFMGIAAEVDPRIRVHCDFAPPGQRPAGFDCRWRFTIGAEPAEARPVPVRAADGSS